VYYAMWVGKIPKVICWSGGRQHGGGGQRNETRTISQKKRPQGRYKARGSKKTARNVKWGGKGVWESRGPVSTEGGGRQQTRVKDEGPSRLKQRARSERRRRW